MKLDVLLTDGDYKNTYAILRALKSEGLKVGILIHKFLSINNFSRLIDKRFLIKTQLIKNPSQDVFTQFFAELKSILTSNEISVFMPIGNVSYKFASQYKNELEKYCKVPVVDDSIMEIAQNKSKTFEYAERVGVSFPKTYRPANEKEIEQISHIINFPCVLKKVNYNESGVLYCNTEEELQSAFTAAIKKNREGACLPVIQEYIRGEGTGYYGVYNEGVCAGYFMHKRIHEYPITGGASTLAKSIFEEDLKEAGDKLLSSLKWHGVAMVEFKREDSTGKLKLIEINPKFWGSFELSHQSGINFAYLAYLVALGKEIPKSSYRRDVYFRWTIPHDIVWYRFASKEQRKDFGKLKKDVKIYSNIHWDDPLPVIFNVIFTIYKLFKENKYPHGHIK